jgi:hypothetical protein
MHVPPTLSHEALVLDAGSCLATLTLGLPSMGPFVLGAVSSWDCDAVLDEPTVSGTRSAARLSSKATAMHSCVDGSVITACDVAQYML